MAKEGSALPLALEPEKTLTFTWKEKTHVPKTVLKAHEPSNQYIVYKVKTTAPKRYVVRPPQGVILPGEDAPITLTMVPKDAEALWNEAEASKGVSSKSDDKFMVQAAVIEEEYYTEYLKDKDEKEMGNALQQLWQAMSEEDKKGGEKQIKSQRLTTKFDFPSDFNPSKGTSPSKPSTGAGGNSADPNASPDVIFADLSALRKKYDDMVAYSVVLTGERDYLTSELEDCKKKLARLTKANTQTESSDTGGSTVIQQKKQDHPLGFSFIQVVVVALVSFILGRVLS